MATRVATAASSVEIPEHSAARRPKAIDLLTVLLAIGAVIIAMRGAYGTAPFLNDAARHCVNGVLLHDMVRDGAVLHPVEYARQFYDKLPAISIPYHPPGFAAFEGTMFTLFGVSYPVARLSVALCFGASVWLLYVLAKRLTRIPALALLATALFHSLPLSRRVSSEVMLEFPSLVVSFAALLVLISMLSSEHALRKAIGFGLVAALALWTKQTSVFLAGVPVFAGLLLYRKRILHHLDVLAGVPIIMVSGFALLELMKFAGATSSSGWPHSTVLEVISHNAGFYTHVLASQLTFAGFTIAICGFAWFVFSHWKKPFEVESSALIGWIIATAAVPLLLAPFSPRYIIDLLPALILVSLLACYRAAQKIRVPDRIPTIAAAVLVVLSCATGDWPTGRLTGFKEAAAYVAAAHPERILLCSYRNGSFTFELRTLQPDHHTTVIRGDALTAKEVQPEAFAIFLRKYGIEYVVLDQTSVDAPFEGIAMSSSGELVLKKTIPVTGEAPGTGTLRIYKNVHPITGPIAEYPHRSQVVQPSHWPEL
jgi:hypothetical protein